MATKVVMEALSPTMEEGRLVKWKKNEGDAVEVGDVLAEVETDKAIMELVARAAGMLLKQVMPAGTTVPVGRADRRHRRAGRGHRATQAERRRAGAEGSQDRGSRQPSPRLTGPSRLHAAAPPAQAAAEAPASSPLRDRPRRLRRAARRPAAG